MISPHDNKMCSNRRHRWWLFWQLKLLDGPQLESHMETYILQNTWFCGNSTQDKMSFSSLCGTLCTKKCTFPICDVNIYQVTESYNINTFTKVVQTDKSWVALILLFISLENLLSFKRSETWFQVWARCCSEFRKSAREDWDEVSCSL